MVKVETISHIRPYLADEFSPREFVPRTQAIAEAYRWGKELHAGQTRLSGEPYFETHCVWVAAFLDQLVGNEAWTIAGLLHDSIEDQDSDLDSIRNHFPGALGEQVAFIVDGVTKLSSPHDGNSRELETLRKIAIFRDPGVFLVKLADKSHNILTLDHMPEPKRIQKATEAIRAYGKLAGILNCYRWRRWLEDMSFPYADRRTYDFVKEKIDSDPRLNLNFINPMMRKLSQIMDSAGISGEVQITVNGYWQAWQKLRRMARERKTSMNSFNALNDLVSFRMIVNSDDETECYRLLAYVNRFFGKQLDHNRFDDYIACPQNGYRALQVTIWLPECGAIEIAIATQAMEGENIWGIIYALKNGKDTSHYNPIEILTPTGGARFLPENSTVLDAVASIQQEFLLDKISAVVVNNKLAALSEIIHPGDVVEVITEGTRLTPNEDWLRFSNISTARLLRSVLAIEGLKKSAENGLKLIKPILEERGILTLEDVQTLEPDKVDNLLEKLACANLEDLYASVGSGVIRLEDFKEKLDETGITHEALKWVSINILGDITAHQPGILARLAFLVSQEGGNILRSVNNTSPNGSFVLRLVVKGLNDEKKASLRQAYKTCGISLKIIELV